MLDPRRDLSDRNDGSIAGEKRLARREFVEFGEDILLERELFRRRLDHHVGIRDGIGKRLRSAYSIDRARVLAEVGEIPGDAGGERSERLLDRVEYGDLMPGDGEDLGDAMAHQPGADDGDFP